MTPEAQDETSADDAVLGDVGLALSRMRRRTSGARRDLARNLILNIVADFPGETTVGRMAAELGVSQPVASRSVAGCITAGLLRREASQDDGRRSVLQLTDAGHAERRRLADEQAAVFQQITEAWSPDEQADFARYLVRYSRDADAWARAARGGAS
ncbi:MarR family winged helix-turn-helix transcriptional regulator [Nocardioides sp. URHA0020]|uniref:MarR family winged helix-turn-helix transcriptional regulator n=1 Tax=Nocardioides sp. URHA0020 TaxID=1380392 RepID=UPI00048B0465|nr:MarR family winged helix-turn-helix transcriptional regulator [Nocardioides sp. URHA0020]